MHIDHRWWRIGTGRAGIVSLVLGVMLTVGASGQSSSPHHWFLGGPWEIVVKMGHEGQTLRLPLSVADENKPQKLGAMLPVMGTPIKVTLQQYVPDLKWDTVAVMDPNGGAVAKLSLRGENLKQDLWLSAREVTRQAISSHIGGVAIRELPEGSDSAKVLEGLLEPATVGALLLTLPGADAPRAYAVRPGASWELPEDQGRVSVLRYVPHYSIDRETKEVASASDKPVNPAVEIRLERGNKEYRQWLWSKFPSSPHRRLQMPFPAKFLDFHLDPGLGQHILGLIPGQTPKLLYLKDGARHIDVLELGRRYSFRDERYSFAVEDVRFGAMIQTRWTNESTILLHPAVVASIAQTDATQEVVLEQNKPYHHKTAFGTLVVLYRRVP